ncbi:hypothetical protein HA466_0068730 [Hirschfeldia incana]|nr:hypothetical protein HA466_0068730 [Hirschfeldia incana]
MTKKHNPLENPPAASSSDDDEVDSSSGEEEEDDVADDASSSEEEEDNQPKPPVKAHSTSAAAAKTATAQQASDADSESETETDSDSDTKQQPPPNQRSGKAIAKDKSLPKSGTKRPSEKTSKETDSKRAKKEEEKKTGEDPKKPAAFQRLWTEEDEISVLQGMIDFKNDTGKSPYDDTNVYFDSIKNSISFEVSKNQFMDKIRSLKKKYMRKEKPCFTKPHDQKSYKLCKFIWGPGGLGLETANGVAKKKNKKVESVSSLNGKKVEDGDDDERVLVQGGGSDWFENSYLVNGIAGFGIDEHYVKQRWRLVSAENKKKVADKVKILRAREIEFVLQKTEFLHEVAFMIAEAAEDKPSE